MQAQRGIVLVNLHEGNRDAPLAGGSVRRGQPDHGGAVYLLRRPAPRSAGAVALGILAGFLIAVGISRRVTRLSRAAGEMAAGAFDAPLDVGGRDEIGDLARALESMRASLKESFGVLTADRNKLQAIFDGLTDVVIVVDEDGAVRFSNSAAAELLDPTGRPPESMLAHCDAPSSSGSPPTRRCGSATAPTR